MKLPPFHGASYTRERTFKNLLGPLGGKCNVWAECLFANPIDDLAILGSPDDYELGEAYEALVESVTPLALADLPLKRERKTIPAGAITVNGKMVVVPPQTVLSRPVWEGSGRMVSLEGELFACTLRAGTGALTILESAQPIIGGMSGSPILNEDGAAVGVVCVSGSFPSPPNPFLMRQLPRWFLDEVGAL